MLVLMSTFIFNLNDTTALSDSVMAQVIKLSEACQPVATDAETNVCDVIIAGVICLAIVGVALIAKCAVLSWKKAEITFKVKECNAKNVNDKEESERKLAANRQERLWDLLKEQIEKNSQDKNKYDAAWDAYKDALK